MIKCQKSFLFFCVLLMSLFFGTSVVSQEKQDSIKFYYNLALNPKNSSDFAKSYEYFFDHKESCLKKDNLPGAIYDLRLLAIIQNESGFYYDSESSAIEAIALLEEMPVDDFTQDSKIGLYNQLGKVSRALKEPNRALEYYNKALASTAKPEQRNKIINNRGFIFLDQQELEKALLDFEEAYKISEEINDEQELARNLDNMGYVKFMLGRTDALLNLEGALQKRLKLNDMEGAYANYNHLFRYYNAQGDAEKAQLYLDKSLAVANTLNSNAYRFDVLSEYVNLSTDSLVIAYKVLSDKIRLDNLLTENKYASKKYDYSQKELEAEKNKASKQFLQLIICLVLIVVFFSYLLLRVKHKRDKMNQVFKTETRISKKIHDELANDVSDLMSYVENELETKPEEKIKLLNSLENIYVRTRDISTETSSVDFSDFAQSLKHLLIQHNKVDVKIIINDINTIDWSTLPKYKKLAVYRVVQELMVNMKKHSQSQLVSVIFKKDKKHNEIKYVDDGRGCAFDNISANGLKNAEFRMKEIGGQLNFETSEGNGFKAVIIFS